VYDIQGRLIKQLIDGVFLAGTREVTWNGRDHSNRPVASGMYIYRLDTAESSLSRQMLLLK